MTLDSTSDPETTAPSLPVLTQGDHAPVHSAPRRAFAVQLLRVVLVGLLLSMLHRPARRQIDASQPPAIDAIRAVIPAATSVQDTADATATWNVSAADESSVGRVARTMPQAAHVRGYRGPTEALLVVDAEDRIEHVSVLDSLDTAEHVQTVRDDAEFFSQFRGWKLTDPTTATRVDGVSGATLTSLALAGGVLQRLGVSQGSLVFPDHLTVDEANAFVKRAFAEQSGLMIGSITEDDAELSGEGKDVAGRVYRSGPLSDDIVGYQGPTEMLMAESRDGVMTKIEIRRSFDNEPYVDYVRTDKYFWRTFNGKSIESLAEFDPVAAGVEGVSGATMTSQAVADTVVAAAKKIVRQQQLANQPTETKYSSLIKQLHFSLTELATVGVLIGLVAFLRVRWRHNHLVRGLWLLTTIGVLGIWAGNLISMSLLAGWAAGGVAWQIAPGLAVLVLASLLAPPLTKSNIYCSHLCPHGAVQQLLRPHHKSRRHLHVSGRVQRTLKFLPPATLVSAYVTLLLRPETDLASWEPFHAYLYPIASVGTIIVAILSLVTAAMLPMAYCRFGCPTGSLLDYLRRSAASRRVGRGDAAAVTLLILALIL